MEGRRHGRISWRLVIRANVKKDNKLDMKPIRARFMPTAGELVAAKKCFPPNYLH
jgi:hypothetical protein